MRRPASQASGGFSPWWTAPTAWGAGLVAAGSGAAATTRPGVAPAGWGAGATLLVLGIAALAWGGIVLAKGRMPLPRVAGAAAVVGILMLAVLLGAAPMHTSVVGVSIGAVLLVATALGAIRGAQRGQRESPLPVWGFLTLAAVLAVAVTPALGSIQDAALLSNDGATVRVVTDHIGH